MDLMSASTVVLDAACKTKEDVVALMADAMDADGRLVDRDAYVGAVFQREEEFSTAIGFGVATPHAKTDAVRVASLGFVRLAEPMPWDGEEVSMVFQIAVPMADAGDRHLQIMAQVSRHLIHEDFRQRLASAQTPEEVVALMGA